MIGMSFISFVILLVISVVVSAVLHYGLKYYLTPGLESFYLKVVLAWVGAWLGSPVFGYWPSRFPFLHYQEVWFVPAILGSLVAVTVAIELDKRARRAVPGG
jgi:uncharacterized membrane protein YeaQ/YmgE (transglycosylase-associated protein family)